MFFSNNHLLLLFSLILLVFSDDFSHHNCIHHKLEYESPSVPSISDLNNINDRLLADQKVKGFDPKEAKPIRIVTDTSALSSLDPALKSLIEDRLLAVAKNFFQKRIKVMPQIGPIKFPNLKRCQTADIPANHLANGVADADLILYVTASNEPKDTYLAWATSCLIGDESTNFRPIAGQINYNSARMKDDLKLFGKTNGYYNT